MIQLNEIATGVELTAEGFWRSRGQTAVSHPEQCQDWYAAVEDSSYWFKHRAQCIVACLKNFPPSGRIFDVGGGNGHVSLAMQNAGYDVTLVEPSLQGVRNAQARGIESILCSTLQDAGLKDHSVAAMSALDVVEHIEDDARFLSTMARRLVPGGRLYLTVPAFNALWSGYDQMVGHYRRYSVGSLSRRLAAAGLAVEYSTYLYSILPLPIWLFRTLPSWLRLRKFDGDQRSFNKEHAAKQGLASRIVAAILGRELKRLQNKRRVWFGSSCLIVARKGMTND